MNNWEKYLLVYQNYLKNQKKGRTQYLYYYTESGVTPIDFLDKLNGAVDSPPRVLTSRLDSEIFDPFFPLLHWIRQELSFKKPQEISDLLKAAEVYPLHQSFFLQYLQGQSTQRFEAIIPMEKEFEKRMMFRSVWSLLERTFEGQSVLFILDQVQDIPASTWDLLRFFQEEGLEGSFAFLLNQQKYFSGHFDHKETQWLNFLGAFEDSRTNLFPDGARYGGTSYLRRYSLKEIGPSLDTAYTLFHFLNLGESHDLAYRLHNLYLHNSENFDEEQTFRLFLLLGNLALSRENPSSAIIHWGSLMSLLQEKDDKSAISWVCERMALAFIEKNDPHQAEALALKSITLAEEAGNTERHFRGLFALLFAQEFLRNLPFEEWRKSYRKFLSLGQELNFTNTMSYWLVNPYHLDSIQYLDEATYYQDWGMRICEQNSNLYRLSDAYQHNGYYWSLKGDWEKVEECYNQAEDLKKAIGHEEELPYIYNGLGYFQLSIGHYLEAQENFIRALEGLKKLKNFGEICLTLYNMGLNGFLSFNFRDALHYFNTLKKIMKAAKIGSLVYHSRFQLLTLIGLSFFKMGNFTRAYEIYQETGRLNYTPFGEELTLSMLLGALVRQVEQENEEAEKLMSKAERYLLDNRSNMKHLIPFFYMEMGNFWVNASKEREATAAFKKGYMESFQISNQLLRDKFQYRLRPEKVSDQKIDLPRPQVDFDWIIDSAVMEKANQELHQEMVARELLWSFSEISLQFRDEEQIIGETMRLFQRVFMLDGVWFITDYGMGWKEAYSNQYLNEGLKDQLLNKMDDFRRGDEPIFVAEHHNNPLTREMNLRLLSLVSIPYQFYHEMRVHLFCTMGKSVRFRGKDLELIALVFKNLTYVLGRIRREAQLLEKNFSLMKAVARDGLTELANRQSLIERVMEERGRIQRYGKGAEATFSVAFFEVDRLAEIADEHGQHVSDQVLIHVAFVFRKMCRQVDFLSRFSAGEFVLVLPQTPLEGAHTLVERIQKHFNQEPLHIRSEDTGTGTALTLKDLSLSCGLANFCDAVSDPLKKADLALREARAQGPGSLVLFEGCNEG